MLSDIVGSMKRRWYIALVGLVATGALGYFAALASPPTYTARGLVLLLPSKAVTGAGGNPLLVMDGLGLPAAVLVAYYQGGPVGAEIAEEVPDTNFVVSVEESTRGPLLAVDVSAPSAESALAALNYVSDSIPENLERLQTEVGAPEDALVTSKPLTMDTEATRDTSGAMRLQILAILAGLVATAVVTSAFDGLLLRRAQGRQRKAEQGKGLRPAEDPEAQPSLAVKRERRFAR